ncbi:MAG: hypothetical protein J7K98_03535 [Candidatus Aenigmarchaeota archaeon]|nr:hypothetical protein [Candidatus Aenigmarchaeota archaeon]
MDKAQSQILGYLIIFVIVASLLSSALLWGLPLITKRKDVKKTTDAENFFKFLANAIEESSKKGTKQYIPFTIEGMLTLYPINYTGVDSVVYNNSLLLRFVTKSPQIPVDTGWIPFETSFNLKQEPYAISGYDKPYFIVKRARKVSNGYEVEYLMKFRGVLDPQNNRIYKILLVGSDDKTPKSTTSGTVIVIPEKYFNVTQNGITYMYTEIKILL